MCLYYFGDIQNTAQKYAAQYRWNNGGRKQPLKTYKKHSGGNSREMEMAISNMKKPLKCVKTADKSAENPLISNIF